MHDSITIMCVVCWLDIVMCGGLQEYADSDVDPVLLKESFLFKAK